ncbi:hypothetical protein [Serratia marcescens]|uniref:hypothetical protein n=1 Tax=Serratia marcescens TaxID=615 RepID=UPI00111559DC|nr:hypothetical protein [Serratia marcescens]
MLDLWVWILWLSLSSILLGMILLLPTQNFVEPFPYRDKAKLWLLRFLKGDMNFGKTVFISLGVFIGVWWCSAAGLLISGFERELLVGVISLFVLIACFNVSRKNSLPLWALIFFSGVQGFGWVALFIMVLGWVGFSV